MVGKEFVPNCVDSNVLHASLRVRNSDYRCCSSSSLQYFFAMVAKYNLHQVDYMDAIIAFLRGDLEEDIYMEQSPCFVKFGGGRQLVCCLNKALYAFKQSMCFKWELQARCGTQEAGTNQTRV